MVSLCFDHTIHEIILIGKYRKISRHNVPYIFQYARYTMYTTVFIRPNAKFVYSASGYALAKYAA